MAVDLGLPRSCMRVLRAIRELAANGPYDEGYGGVLTLCRMCSLAKSTVELARRRLVDAGCLHEVNPENQGGRVKGGVLAAKIYRPPWRIPPENRGTPPPENRGTPPPENRGTPPPINRGPTQVESLRDELPNQPVPNVFVRENTSSPSEVRNPKRRVPVSQTDALMRPDVGPVVLRDQLDAVIAGIRATPDRHPSKRRPRNA